MSIIIDVQNIEYRYEDGTQALSEVELKIEKGEFLAVLGHNGFSPDTSPMEFSGTGSGDFLVF